MLNTLTSLLLIVALVRVPLAVAQTVVFIKKDTALAAGSYNGTTSKMSSTTAFVTDYPLTIFFYAEPSSTSAANKTIAAVSEPATTGDVLACNMFSTDVRAFARGATQGITVARTSAVTLNTKRKGGCIFTSATSRAACGNNGCTASADTTGALSGFARTTLGVMTLNVDSQFWVGKDREVGMIATALSEANYQAYEAGTATLESLGFDCIWRGASGANDGGDSCSVTLTPTDVTEVAW